HRPRRGAAAQLVERLGLRPQLLAVAGAELGEALRPMAEPAAQPGAGRQLLGPAVDRELLPRDAARPDAVDPDPVPVDRLRRVVGALDAHFAHGPRLPRPMGEANGVCGLPAAGPAVVAAGHLDLDLLALLAAVQTPLDRRQDGDEH